MDQIFEKPLEEIVKARHSVRTYSREALSPETLARMEAYIQTLSSPFGEKAEFRLIAPAQAENARQLGTYGMIKGAPCFIGVVVDDAPRALETVGYEFEKLILYAASLGLGTCWLGGTFNKGEFAKAMQVRPGQLFPAISPLGWPENKRISERLVRLAVKADQRRPWRDLFFRDGFSQPLTPEEAGSFAFPLEMVRLAPSASNKQPWRIVACGGAFHFYEAKEEGYSDRLGFDIQRIDLGIAACHFHLAALESGLQGEFRTESPEVAGVPANTRYVFSWLPGAKSGRA